MRRDPRRSSKADDALVVAATVRATSFYLPVPEAKQILSKRVAFVKAKLNDDQEAAHNYFSQKGFQVSIDNLQIIAEAIEGVLIEQDYVSGLIGRLGNFDIRRMLQIAKRIFLSPEIRIDDVVKSHFSGRPITTDRYRTFRALIKGEYDRFSEEENEFTTNLFLTDPQSPSSPLLSLYILWLLRVKQQALQGSAPMDDRHWTVSDAIDYFEVAGVSNDLTLRSLQKLLSRGLVEEYNPNVQVLSSEHRLAVKDAGIAHIDLVTDSTTYVEQCALSTGLNERSVRDKLKELRTTANRESFLALREVFLHYVLRVDASRVTIPSHIDYQPMRDVRNRVRQLKTVR